MTFTVICSRCKRVAATTDYCQARDRATEHLETCPGSERVEVETTESDGQVSRLTFKRVVK